MPIRTAYEPGTPCWIDLVSPDVDASGAFYTKLFGWKAEAQSDSSGRWIYTMFRKGKQDAAGLSAQPPAMAGAPPVWNSYISVADADKTVIAAEEAGAKILMPAMDVMDAGRMAVIADPTGAVFSIWQAGKHAGAGVINEPNAYAWNELLSSDVETAKSFYAEVFGWTYTSMDLGPAGIYWVIEGGDSGGLGGLMTRPKALPAQAPDGWLVYFLADDITAKVTATTKGGGSVIYGPADIPGVGTIATLADPQGGVFSLMQPKNA